MKSIAEDIAVNNNIISTVSDFAPIYVSEEQMGAGETKPLLGKQRADKINAIIKQCYNQLVATTSQHKQRVETTNQLITNTSNRILNYRDIGFLMYHTISFIFNTDGLKSGKTYPLIVIKDGDYINDDINFLGVNNANKPSDFINNYGFFLFTYNPLAKEKQISFRCLRNCPSTTFGVYMTLLYEIKDKVKGDFI